MLGVVEGLVGEAGGEDGGGEETGGAGDSTSVTMVTEVSLDFS